MICETCYEYEHTVRQKVKLLKRYSTADAISRMGASTAELMRVGIGQPALNWYEVHRENYVNTGDELELTRMLRHVS